ncbi:MAG: hypothetical protein O3C25_02105 [Chloroflexi bacterium]|nr:hypothetical protein [Chloroflexota bacterium]
MSGTMIETAGVRVPYFYASLDWEATVREYQPAPAFFEGNYLLPPAEVRRLQEERIAACVAHAWSTEFYRERWQAAGVRGPEEVRTLEDLRALPTYVVDDLRQSIEEAPPFGRYQGVHPEDTPDAGPVRIHTSGGTTGRPRPTLYTLRDRQGGAILRQRAFYLAGFRPGDAVQNTMLYSTHNGPFIVDEALYQWLGCVPVTTSAGIVTRSTRQIEIMRDWNVRGLVGFQDYVIQLARTAKEMGIDVARDLKLAHISTMGGNPRLVEKEWGLPALENYGMHETQVMASECPARAGMHLWEDAFVIDIVDIETGEPLPDGEVGSIVTTALYKTGVPVVRYDTKDTTRVLSRERCECGSQLTRIDFLQGRADTMVKLRGVNVWPEACGDVAKRDPRVGSEYFCIADRVDARDEMTLLIETEPGVAAGDREAIARDVADALRAQLSVSIAVEVRGPGELQELTRFGIESKPRRFEDRRKQAR